ncbi:MAG: CHAT domain-containing protein [Leptolyngbyaceae cyanobacterium bins.302]|nr:CHAT domain-containing protein [Leptolyngbyaceae cyanobacterium bins.302]
MRPRRKSTSFALATLLFCVLSPCLPAQSASAPALAQVSASQARREANRLFNLGSQQFQRNQFEQALATFQQALKLYQQARELGGQGDVLLKLGQVHEILGQYDQSLTRYQQAAEIFAKLGERDNRAGALSGVGIAYLRTGKYSQAIAAFQEALNIIPNAGVPLNGLGLAYIYLGQYDKALKFHQQVLAIRRANRNRAGEATSLLNIGTVYKGRVQYQDALNSYQQALEIYRQVRNPTGQVRSLNLIGELYNLQKQPSQAMSFFQEALKLSRTIDDSRGQSIAFDNIGRIHFSLQQYSQALDFYEQALTIRRKGGDREGEGKTLSNIGELFAEQDQSELAIVFYKQSVNIYESIRRDLQQLPSEQQESYTQSVASTYRRLADLLIAQGRIGEAQQILERLKIQELNDFTKGTRAPATIAEVGFNSLETQIKGKYTSLIAFGSKYYDCEQQRCPQHNELKTQYQGLSKEFQIFVEQIKQQLRDSKLTQVDKSTQDFQTSADRVVTAHLNSILIYPLVLPDKTRLLWAAKGGVLSKTAVCPLGETALYNKVAQLQTLISKRGNETQLKAVGKELYDCLIQPLESELAANKIQHLIFVPDRATNYIPMGALFDGNQYLIQRFAVSNVLSASLTDTDDRLKSPQQTPILALGLSQAKGNFGALPNVETELNAIVKQSTANRNATGIYPGQVFLNPQFTKAALEDNIRGHRIIHIATHGGFKPENPRDSYFLLGTGTPYPIPDVQTLRDLKDVHLVVLSACQTGLGGADGLGLEVTGISSFFMGDRDRAKAVIASLWNVNDTSTALIMQQFYKNLATGNLTKAEALRQAQLSLLQSKLTDKNAPRRSNGDADVVVSGTPAARLANFSHPYYWAPFILIGNSL